MSEQARLPVPDRLEPKKSKRTIMMSVRVYFYMLYNATNDSFRKLLESVRNNDAITGNRLFDRHNATLMIKEAAKKAEDSIVLGAKDGDVYYCIVNLMRQHNMGLKLRRQEYKRLMHQAPAE